MNKMNVFEVLTMIGTMIDSLNFEHSMTESMHWHVTDNGAIVYTMDKEDLLNHYLTTTRLTNMTMLQ